MLYEIKTLLVPTFKTKVPLKTYTESSISINDEIMNKNNISEQILSHNNSTEIIDLPYALIISSSMVLMTWLV